MKCTPSETTSSPRSYAKAKGFHCKPELGLCPFDTTLGSESAELTYGRVFRVKDGTGVRKFQI